MNTITKREVKKDHILSAGLEVMKTHGYNGTSVKDIVDAAKVPKGSFYNYFESKEVFAIEALEKVAQEASVFTQAKLQNPAIAPRERLLAFFNSAAEFAVIGEFKVGCFFGNMCQEMSDSNEVIRDKVRGILSYKTRSIESVIDEAKNAGQVSQDIDAGMMAEFLFNAWEGALLRMKASRTRKPLDAFLNALPSLLR